MHWFLTRLHPLERGIGIAIIGLGVLLMSAFGQESLVGLAGVFVAVVGGCKFIAGPMRTTGVSPADLAAVGSLMPGSAGGPGVDAANCIVGSIMLILASLIVGIVAPSGPVQSVAWTLVGAGFLLTLASVLGAVDDRRRR